jgi:hypothetical protein
MLRSQIENNPGQIYYAGNGHWSIPADVGQITSNEGKGPDRAKTPSRLSGTPGVFPASGGRMSESSDKGQNCIAITLSSCWTHVDILLTFFSFLFFGLIILKLMPIWLMTTFSFGHFQFWPLSVLTTFSLDHFWQPSVMTTFSFDHF